MMNAIPEKPVIEWPPTGPLTVDGWKHLIIDRNGDPICGWTNEDEFVAWASTEAIAGTMRDWLIEMQELAP